MQLQVNFKCRAPHFISALIVFFLEMTQVAPALRELYDGPVRYSSWRVIFSKEDSTAARWPNSYCTSLLAVSILFSLLMSKDFWETKQPRFLTTRLELYSLTYLMYLHLYSPLLIALRTDPIQLRAQTKSN